MYALDTSQQFDERFVYKNQRLNGSWFFIYVDSVDRWVISDRVPNETVSVPPNPEGFCNQDVATPNQCTACWYLFGGFNDVTEEQCEITLVATDSLLESECIGQDEPVSDVEYTQRIELCFDDDEVAAHLSPFSGQYELEPDLWADRAVWSNGEHLLYYSAQWKC